MRGETVGTAVLSAGGDAHELLLHGAVSRPEELQGGWRLRQHGAHVRQKAPSFTNFFSVSRASCGAVFSVCTGKFMEVLLSGGDSPLSTLIRIETSNQTESQVLLRSSRVALMRAPGAA